MEQMITTSHNHGNMIEYHYNNGNGTGVPFKTMIFPLKCIYEPSQFLITKKYHFLITLLGVFVKIHGNIDLDMELVLLYILNTNTRILRHRYTVGIYLLPTSNSVISMLEK